jgi:hypothetical protein
MVVASGSVIVEDMTEHEHAAGQMGIGFSDDIRGVEQKAKQFVRCDGSCTERSRLAMP